MMVLTERKVDHLKFIDPGHPLRTAYQTNSQSLSIPSLLNLNCYLPLTAVKEHEKKSAQRL